MEVLRYYPRYSTVDFPISLCYNNRYCHFKPCSTDFTEISETKFFVDKTMFIKEVMEFQSDGILLTAPKGYGKTTNLNMLKQFLDISGSEEQLNLFNKTNSSGGPLFKIAKFDKQFVLENLGRHPVLHIDFSQNLFDDWRASFDQTIRSVFNSYAKTYLEYSTKLDEEDKKLLQLYVCDDNERVSRQSMKSGITLLLRLLYKHFEQKIIILIDDYDFGIFSEDNFIENDYFEEIEHLSIFLITLIESEFSAKTIITGRTYFANQFLQRRDNFRSCNFLGDHQFVRYFGLTTAECYEICQKNNVAHEYFIEDFLAYFGRMTSMYQDCYMVDLFWFMTFLSEYIEAGYLNVMQMIQQFAFVNEFREIATVLQNPHIMYCIMKMMQGETVNFEIPREFNFKSIFHLTQLFLHPNDKTYYDHSYLFFIYLMQRGYISPFLQTMAGEYVIRCSAKISNRATHSGFQFTLTDYFYFNFNLRFDCVRKVSKALNRFSDFNRLSDAIYDFYQSFEELIQMMRILNHNDEEEEFNDDHIRDIIFGIVCMSKFLYKTKIMFCGDKPAIVVYYMNVGVMIEVGSSSKVALAKILEKKYAAEFLYCNNRIMRTVSIGINVNRWKAVSISYIDCELGMDHLQEPVHLM